MALDEDPPFADLTLVCSGRSFKVHKTMLYHYSDWFKAALTSEFQVSSTSAVIVRDSYIPEGTAATITLEEDDPNLVEAMLKHCYRHSYEDCRMLELPCISISDAKMFCLADKYQCRALALEIATHFERNSDKLVWSKTFAFLDIIYALPAGSLVTVFRDMFRRDFTKELPYCLQQPEFQRLCQRHPLLACDCLDMINTQHLLKGIQTIAIGNADCRLSVYSSRGLRQRAVLNMDRRVVTGYQGWLAIGVRRTSKNTASQASDLTVDMVEINTN